MSLDRQDQQLNLAVDQPQPFPDQSAGMKKDDHIPMDDHGLETHDEESPNYKNNVQRSNILSYLNFWFQFETVKKAFKFARNDQKLDDKTLPGLAWNYRAEVMEAKLWDYYFEHKKKNMNSKINLALSIVKVIKWQLVFWFLLEITFLCTRIFSAYEAYRLLNALYDPTDPESEKWVWAAILSGTLIIALYMEHHLMYIKSIIPLYVRACLISMIYTKASHLSVYSLNKISLGKVVNIVANDLNVFERAGLFFSNVVTGILGLIIGGALLWFWFGPVCLVGLGYIAFSYILQEFLMKKAVTPRTRQNAVTDQRIKATSELLEGIRLLKIYTWELAFGEAIKGIRKKEVGFLTSVHRHETSSRGIAFSTQALASYLIFMPFVLLDNALSVSIVFPTFLVIGYLRIWAGFYFCMGLSFLSETKLIIERIAKILEVPEMEERTFEEPKDPENAVEFEKFTACWTKEDSEALKNNPRERQSDSQELQEIKPALIDINISIKKGSVNAIIGTIGAGKTSFLLSFTGEMPKTEGSLRYKGSIAYVGQEPITFAGTFKENILFGKPYKAEFYEKVVKACNLENDFKIFRDGDMSHIGERGGNLSGGQKARLAFARAVYADADIYLLDDPLSAVDAKVAKSLFNDTIKTALKGKTVILSTHQVHFIKELENIMIIDRGSLVANGCFEKLKEQYPQVIKIFGKDLKPSLSRNNSFPIRDSETESNIEMIMVPRQPEEARNEHEHEQEQEQEQRRPIKDRPEDPSLGDDPYARVTVGWKTYQAYFKEIGGAPFITLIFVLFLCTELGTAGFGRMLGAWATGKFSQWKSLAIVGGLTGFIFAIYIVKNIVFSTLLMKAAHRFHTKMLDRIIRNPVLFFDTNPLGRILNRFSNDIGVLDRFLPISALDVVDLFFLVGNLVLTTAIIVPLTLAPFGLAFILIVLLFMFCYASISQSRNFDLASRSPMYSLFSASLSGILIIRIYKQTHNFTHKFRRLVNSNTKGGIGFWTCARFLGFNVDVIYNLCTVGNIFILTAMGGQGSGLSGLCLIFILSITGVLQFALRQLVQTHVLMASVARVQAYCETPTEAALSVPEDGAVRETGWPQEGNIEFSKVYMRYRPEADHVIKDLSLAAKSGEKIGCIGRTGAGKSSIIQMLFRMVEIERTEQEKQSSYIKIDELDIQRIGLHLLRNSISIIPQSPFVFTGTIRRNLDPFEQASDQQLWKALADVGLKEHVERLENKLDTDMTNASAVFSIGQKQLICLARTLLKTTKMLVLDEATANVDKQTDDFIQRTILSKFSNCTIFTIAHRLSTIANYDKVLVLDKGRKMEFDAPYRLLVKNIGDDTITNVDGHFASMVLNTGPKTSHQILKIAKKAYFSRQGENAL